jgi:hypothetical protein
MVYAQLNFRTLAFFGNVAMLDYYQPDAVSGTGHIVFNMFVGNLALCGGHPGVHWRHY